jgi:hypothetical protein
MKETSSSTWPGPERKLQHTSHRAWEWLGVQERAPPLRAPPLAAGGEAQTANEIWKLLSEGSYLTLKRLLKY